MHTGKSSSRRKINHVLLRPVSKSIKSLQVKCQLSGENISQVMPLNLFTGGGQEYLEYVEKVCIYIQS